MPRPLLFLFALSLLALVLTVPWFFFSESPDLWFGFPSWALYTILASVCYATLISFLLGRFWELSAGKVDSEEATKDER